MNEWKNFLKPLMWKVTIDYESLNGKTNANTLE